jgi:hypothetical protein
VVGVQDQDAVQSAHQHVVDLVLFARVGDVLLSWANPIRQLNTRRSSLH